MDATIDGDTLVLTGCLDGRATGLVRERLHDLMSTDHDLVVVEMTAVEYVDVTGMTMLAAASKMMERNGRRLVLRGCSPSLRRIIAFTRVRSLLLVEREAAGA